MIMSSRSRVPSSKRRRLKRVKSSSELLEVIHWAIRSATSRPRPRILLRQQHGSADAEAIPGERLSLIAFAERDDESPAS